MAEAGLLSKLFLAGLCLLAAICTGTAQANTPIAQIIDTAQRFLEQQIQDHLHASNIEARYNVSINRLDPRLRMAACDQPLTPSLESPQQPVGRVTLRIRCEGSSPWSIFVPAQVNLYRNVAVASRPIQRNNLIQPRDIILAERDVGSLNQGYILDLENIIGNQATRAIQVDQVISPNHLRAPAAVKRGEQVFIVSGSNTVRVRIPGEALSDGAIGDQIRVRNIQSQRIIHARVIGPGEVQAGR